ncbi:MULTISPECIES: cupin domain-containing protein [Methylobacterium]|uniref:Cupin n=2 Tax=Methylobacterium TaxID=407 RepID=A0A0C6F175_9HYPH|nr:cupin domain-containing protein [Methylobacterium aquaticum]BAQ46296.1 cupin [Methylobacterium aquaticum]
MTLLVTIDTDPTFEPKHALPLPERLIAGSPSFKTWAQDESRGETVKTGIWEATPGESHSIKGTTFEFCHILSGLVEIEEKGGETKTYRAGDSFVMKPGFVGVWRTIETVRKIYVCVYE